MENNHIFKTLLQWELYCISTRMSFVFAFSIQQVDLILTADFWQTDFFKHVNVCHTALLTNIRKSTIKYLNQLESAQATL